MALRKIVEQGDECLTKVCRPVTKFDRRLHDLLDDMAETLADANGAGLAAPQVGILRRVCLVLDEEAEEYLELINPEIIAQEGSQCGREGCLSLPGRQGVVTRPMKVTVKAQDRHGNPIQITGEGFFARAICHELDHLDGVLYIDKMDRELTPEEIEGHIKEDDD